MTTRFGCRSTSELVQRVTRVSKQRAGDLVKAARAVVQPTALTSGEVLPRRCRRCATRSRRRGRRRRGGRGCRPAARRAVPGTAAILAADEEIAATARGEGADAAPPACAEELRALATVWAMYLDQDGAEPDEARALRKRGITIGPCRDGLHPVRGQRAARGRRAAAARVRQCAEPESGRRPGTGGAAFQRLRRRERCTVDPDDPDRAAVGDRR